MLYCYRIKWDCLKVLYYGDGRKENFDNIGENPNTHLGGTLNFDSRILDTPLLNDYFLNRA